MPGIVKGFITNFGRTGTIVVLSIICAWLFFMVISPQLIALEYSFRHLLPLSKVGGPSDVLTLNNYITLFTIAQLLLVSIE